MLKKEYDRLKREQKKAAAAKGLEVSAAVTLPPAAPSLDEMYEAESRGSKIMWTSLCLILVLVVVVAI